MALHQLAVDRRARVKHATGVALHTRVRAMIVQAVDKFDRLCGGDDEQRAQCDLEHLKNIHSGIV